MIITLIIIFNQIVSVFDINKLVTYKHKLLKSYSRENFHNDNNNKKIEPPILILYFF